MKILVVGAGGVGGYYGAVLSKSHHEVLILARGTHLAAIRDKGLSLRSENSGNFTVYPEVSDTLNPDWKADLVLFCVKSYHNSDAMIAMGPAIADSTNILTLQNGIGSGNDLSNNFGGDKVILGATYIDGWVDSPGIVAEQGEPFKTVFGEEANHETARIKTIEEAFLNAGIDAEISENINDSLWIKLLYICGLSGMSCITQGSIKHVLEDTDSLKMLRSILLEVKDVGLARGINFDQGIVDQTIDNMYQNRETLTSSMYLDMIAGKPLEISVLNGAVVNEGRNYGIKTPLNDFINTCLSIVDSRARGLTS
ncbi:MAG: 2-dehydropantoate 2-reductase [Chloroflexota bacterium]|nr:2-dehydropantoate 2-reductase [Chloroflexota bacterium]